VNLHLEDRGGFYVASNATVVKNVEIGEHSSVWYGTVVRGDVAKIRIGSFTNLQDLTVVHPEHDEDLEIGDYVTVGHRAILHMRTLGSGTLVGMGAILMAHTHIGKECIIGAGALIPEGENIPDRTLLMGIPARRIRSVTDEEAQHLREHARTYASMARDHLPGA
jgi:carbonic anhydrase/acetyltransferase-like protein (isoleucine patch superfamily)